MYSWGRSVRSDCALLALPCRTEELPPLPDFAGSYLPFGNGRSYGDSCLNTGGALLSTHGLDRFIAFDPGSGILCCESGVQLAEISRLMVPRGWFLPVTPGTRFVTIGGAIANDVHGKNHHGQGTFGCHVLRFMLRRSDGAEWLCSPDENPDWFSATIGGLGLTGLILWAEIQLRRIENPWIVSEAERFSHIDEFFELSESGTSYEYKVAWLDCSGPGRRMGRGIFTRADHAPAGFRREGAARAKRPAAVGFTPPFSLVNTWSVRAFNSLYFHRAGNEAVSASGHCESYFYPLDHVRHWNRIYGPRGFYQYQCVVPSDGQGREAVAELLRLIAGSGMASFLAVLKQFGDRPSPGLLSFPQPGTTLALDFPNRGEALHRLFASLDAVVMAVRGRLYPAKDARMPGNVFRAGYPQWHRFSSYIDPAFSSSFWRRVMEDE
ncbi:Decaprenylphosphoryl-beta-D-ribose oxidase [Cupriavidus yeoncheonensis]|uniref:Decaprenylphosphoryl-beta-D-ribose oxidase n=1 Tax=Cupriavidus yeoncheonensis TaxID=1462994 RepID=A0A916IRV1_9BURK|nr:FAD-binding oxidoreductase [Cupriavidus yeoncheonensis]CAG2140163.1 Decaprenylphosphoryl-beta-D-ribose oxidase [Cupriavidus yeoncheonensis]